ncbi:MAG: Fe(2+)-trafficking protein [Gemmataceae bacterium]
MSSNHEKIAQFRNMATADPDNELAHYRLGGLLMEEKQYEEAIASFRRTLELSPVFSKVYQLLGQCQLALGQKDEAIQTWEKGFAVADERGDYMPRDEMSRLLVAAGRPAPVTKKPAESEAPAAGGTGNFRCQRPTCMMGNRARQLPNPPFRDELGARIQANVCADCWMSWVRDYSIKVINELRLDLSRDEHQATYDRYMLEFLGLEEPATPEQPR